MKRFVQQAKTATLRAVIMTALVLGWVMVLSTTAAHSTGTESSLTNTAPQSSVNSGAKAPKKSKTVVTTTNAVPPTRNCAPASYAYPQAVDLTTAPAGVTTVTESTQYYRIYGRTTEEQLSQLRKCAPVGEYAGAASYRLSWQYSYGENQTGLCSITEAKIGLHLSMVLPTWNQDTYTDSSVAARWADFSSALRNHEQGHYKLSKQYAALMHDALRSFAPTNCATIKQRADSKLSNLMAQLESAQHNYDKNTDHGTTQGALL